VANSDSAVQFLSSGFSSAGDEGVLQNTPLGVCAIQFYEDAGSGVITSYSFTIYGSLDGTNYAAIGSAVTSESIVGITDPVGYIKVKMTAESMTVDAAVYATMTRVW